MPKISLMKEPRSKQEKPPMTKFQLTLCCLAYGMVFMMIFASVMMHIDSMPDDYYIFQSIDECEALIPNDQSEVKIERYATPNADKDLKDIPYESFFGMQFKSDEMKYQIFAYEFEDFESALKYFVNASGTSYSYEEDRATIEQYDYALYFVAKNPLSCHFVVISQNNVYQLRAPNRYFDEIYAVLKDIFSKQVTMLR